MQLGPWLRSLPHGLRTPLSGLDAPLSLGERRRLAMARSLAGPAPRLWLLDEPTAGLDQASARRLVTELGRIVDGVTAIIATHDPSAAERLASHNLGLGLQAGVRSWLYRRLEQLLPAGLPGGDRGDLLARLIGDTEEAQDLVVRAAVPVLAAAAAWCAVVTAAFLLPAAGWAILAAGVLATAGVTVTGG